MLFTTSTLTLLSPSYNFHPSQRKCDVVPYQPRTLISRGYSTAQGKSANILLWLHMVSDEYSIYWGDYLISYIHIYV